ncbi:hypothetical protein ES703_70987 [subsurface metagenome]
MMSAVEFAEKYGMSVGAAQDTLDRYIANPSDPEFGPVAGIMYAATGVRYTSYGEAPGGVAGTETSYNGIAAVTPETVGPVPNGIAQTQPAISQVGAETDDVMLTSMGVPLLVGPAIALAARYLTFGVLKRLFFAIGKKALIAIIGLAAFKEFMDMLGVGAPDETLIKIKRPGYKKRYTIGHNPRVRTLAKVSRHCMRMLKRHDKVIREFLPKKQPRYGIPPRQALSAIERKAIAAGGG